MLRTSVASVIISLMVLVTDSVSWAQSSGEEMSVLP